MVVNSVFSCCPNSVFTKGILLLLIWKAVMHSFTYNILLLLDHAGIFNDHNSLVKNAVLPVYCIILIIVLFIYPVAGLVAELYWNRYKVMVLGTILVLISAMIATPSMIFVSTENCDQSQSGIVTMLTVFCCLGIALHLVGLSLFQANAIQFGAEQLQFASSEKLSTYIHWFYWSTSSKPLYSCSRIFDNS